MEIVLGWCRPDGVVSEDSIITRMSYFLPIILLVVKQTKKGLHYSFIRANFTVFSVSLPSSIYGCFCLHRHLSQCCTARAPLTKTVFSVSLPSSICGCFCIHRHLSQCCTARAPLTKTGFSVSLPSNICGWFCIHRYQSQRCTARAPLTKTAVI